MTLKIHDSRGESHCVGKIYAWYCPDFGRKSKKKGKETAGYSVENRLALDSARIIGFSDAQTRYLPRANEEPADKDGVERGLCQL